MNHSTSPAHLADADDILPISSVPVSVEAILEAHTDEVWAVKWSSTGAYLATGSRDRNAIIWKFQPETGEFDALHTLNDHAYQANCLSWSQDDSCLITVSETVIRIWDVKTGKCMKTLDEHTETVTAVQWLPQGHGFISAALDKRIIFWNAVGEMESSITLETSRPIDVAVSPDSRRLVVLGMNFAPKMVKKEAIAELSSSHQLAIYDLKSREVLSSISFRGLTATGVSISGDSRYALVNESPGGIHLCDLRVGRVVKTYPGNKHMRHVIKSSFGGENEEYIVSGSEGTPSLHHCMQPIDDNLLTTDGKVYIWDSKTTCLLHALAGHGLGTVNAVDWKPFSKDTFASCSDDTTVRVWKLEFFPETIDQDAADNQDSWVVVDPSDFA